MATFNRESKTFSELVTFTRASSGWYWDETGTLQEAGTDEPRFDHDPVTGEALGLLIEGQRTNLLLQSVDLTDAAWSKTQVGVSAGETGPDGTASAFLVTPSGTSDIISQAVTTGGAEVYTVSAFLKAGAGAEVAIVLTGAVGTAISAAFDLDSGSVTISAGASEVTDAAITPQGSGWYRVSVSFVTTSGGGLVNFRLSSLAEAGATYYTVFPQFELGRTAGSPIMTEDAAVTRAEDLVYSAPAAGLINLDEGTYFAEFTYRGQPDFAGYIFGSQLGVSIDYRNMVFWYRNKLQWRGGSDVPQIDGPSNLVAGETYRVAFTYGGGRARLVVNGQDYGSTSYTPSSYLTSADLRIGSRPGDGAQLGGTIKDARYYRRALTLDELEELTAL